MKSRVSPKPSARRSVFATSRVDALRAAAADVESIQGCLAACADYFRRAEDREVGRHDGADLLAEAAADVNRRLFILCDKLSSSVVGLLDLVLDYPAPAEATIALLVFTPDYRGRGLGHDLATGLLSWLGTSGYAMARLGVRPRAVGAREFWASVGFARCGSEEGIQLFERALTGD